MRQLIVLTWVLCCPLLVSGQSLVVVDDQGQPVERFQVMIHTADKGYQAWRAGTGGLLSLKDGTLAFYRNSLSVDLLVRADGYAAVTQRFSGQELQDRSAQPKITLHRGREVRLKLRLPSGVTFPKGFWPEFYFSDFAWRVEVTWQPVNRRDRAAPDFNLLGVKAVSGKPGEYVLRLPRDKREFFVGIYHPGWLRYFRAGPFTTDDFKDDQLTIDVPKSGSIAAKLDWGNTDPADLPCKGVQYELMRMREDATTVWIAERSAGPLDSTQLEVSDLAPGTYFVTARTNPKIDEGRHGPDSPINPGRFAARLNIVLQPGQVVRETIAYVPFDPNASRGDRAVRLRVTGVDGLPAAGKELKVRWYDGRYGYHSIFDGSLPADGSVMLEGISSVVRYEAPFGPYQVEVAGERLGFFRVAPTGPTEEFRFHLTAKAGDTAPNAELVALDTGERTRIEQLRGQIVYLEFWETGCGPCQPAMAKLNEIMGAKAADWSGKVAVIPLCLDAEPQIIAKHVKTRGWTNLRHYRSDRTEDTYFADAARAFGVMAYPTAFLIDAQGKITWRGHPTQHDLVDEVHKLQRMVDAGR